MIYTPILYKQHVYDLWGAWVNNFQSAPPQSLNCLSCLHLLLCWNLLGAVNFLCVEMRSWLQRQTKNIYPDSPFTQSVLSVWKSSPELISNPLKWEPLLKSADAQNRLTIIHSVFQHFLNFMWWQKDVRFWQCSTNKAFSVVCLQNVSISNCLLSKESQNYLRDKITPGGGRKLHLRLFCDLGELTL